MAQPQSLELHVNVDISPVRAKLRRILALAKEVNVELAQIDERDAVKNAQIAELREQLKELRIGFQLEEGTQ